MMCTHSLHTSPLQNWCFEVKEKDKNFDRVYWLNDDDVRIYAWNSKPADRINFYSC